MQLYKYINLNKTSNKKLYVFRVSYFIFHNIPNNNKNKNNRVFKKFYNSYTLAYFLLLSINVESNFNNII